MSAGTAFVAGATGYTGRHVVRVLRDGGLRVVAHVRPDSPRLDEWRARFELLGAEVDSTPWNDGAMATTLQGLLPRVVFSLLGTTRSRGRMAAQRGSAEESYETVDYALTSLLLRAARTVDPPPRFVYLSAVGARPDTRSAYLSVRARLERELDESGLPYTVVRPSFITGADREGRTGERVAASLTDAFAGLAGVVGATRVRDRFRSITGERLAQALVRLALDPAQAGRVVEGDELRS